MKPLITFFGLLICLVALSACGDSSPVESKSTVKDILVSTTWLIEKAYDVTTGTKIDVSTQFSGIYQNFNTNGTYTASVKSGSWELSSGEKDILFDKGTSSEITANILECSKGKLVIKMPYSNGSAVLLLQIEFVPSSAASISPVYNFDTLWKEFDTRYSFFAVKKINWDSLYTFYRAKINENTSSQDLFNVMASMLSQLKDAHVSLTSPVGSYSYNYYSKYPANFISTNAITPYLSKDYGTTADGMIRFGKIENTLGYIYVGPSLTASSSSTISTIDMIIDSLKNMKGIIVDIRNNVGGNDALGNIIASRFADATRIYSYSQFRNGPKHTDFTELVSHTIAPAGKAQFLKPVALLTNRRDISSAEGTILMFRVLPSVTTIGDTTGGGSANPIALTLPNSWSYRVSRWIQYTAEKEVFENKGLAPNIVCQISQTDFNNGKDAILEKAIQYIKNK